MGSSTSKLHLERRDSTSSASSLSTSSTNGRRSSKVKESKSFSDLYTLGSEIGVGSFAKVVRCYRKDNGQEFAVKSIEKRYLTEKELIGLREEIKILKLTNHPHVIKMIDVFDDGKHVQMVLELCEAHDLFDAIIAADDNRFDEPTAAYITYTIATALDYLHSNGVVHRDLKPENILFDKQGSPKITDFGLAHSSNVTDSEFDEPLQQIKMYTCCGTPHYVSPEVITQSEYDSKCDLWSLGVILYVMLVGYQPFNAPTLNRIYKLIARGKYDLKSERWQKVSAGAKHLVRALLCVDPQRRYSAQQVQQHPWIRHNVAKYKHRAKQAQLFRKASTVSTSSEISSSEI